MTHDNSALFDVPPSAEPRLQAARKRLAKAQEQYDAAVRSDEECDGFGDIAYRELRDECAAARYELALAERERLTAAAFRAE